MSCRESRTGAKAHGNGRSNAALKGRSSTALPRSFSNPVNATTIRGMNDRLGPPASALYPCAVRRAAGRSPTTPLYIGLVITLAAVVGYSGHVTPRIATLRELLAKLIDRNSQN